MAQSGTVGYCQEEDQGTNNEQNESVLHSERKVNNALRTFVSRDLDPKLIGHNTEDLCITIILFSQSLQVNNRRSKKEMEIGLCSAKRP
jgi:hypothetical protein